MVAEPKDTVESKPLPAGAYETGGTSAFSVIVAADEPPAQKQDTLAQNVADAGDQEGLPASPAPEGDAAQAGSQRINNDIAEAGPPAFTSDAAETGEPVFIEATGAAIETVTAAQQDDFTQAGPVEAPAQDAFSNDNLTSETAFSQASEDVGLAQPRSEPESAGPAPDEVIFQAANYEEAAPIEEAPSPSAPEFSEDEPLAAALQDASQLNEPENVAPTSFTTETSSTNEIESAGPAESSLDNRAAETSSEEPAATTEAMEQPMNEYSMNVLQETIAQNEAAYENSFRIFEQASQSLRTAFDEAGSGAAKLTFKLFEFAQANAESNMELAREYASVRSLPEALDVQAAYLKRQFELLTAQVGELRDITTDIAAKSASPFKEQVERSMKVFHDQ